MMMPASCVHSEEKRAKNPALGNPQTTGKSLVKANPTISLADAVSEVWSNPVEGNTCNSKFLPQTMEQSVVINGVKDCRPT